MQADQLFLRTLEDLDRRTTVADEYEVLLAAGLLRKLLLDEVPLVHQVNRYRRERIRFRINGESPLERTMLEDEPVFWVIGDAIDPDAFPVPGMSASMDAKLDQLLARTGCRVHVAGARLLLTRRVDLRFEQAEQSPRRRYGRWPPGSMCRWSCSNLTNGTSTPALAP